MIQGVDFSSSNVALYDGAADRAISYRDLGQRVAQNRALLRALARPAVVFQFTPNGAGAVAAYLACLAEGLPLGLAEPSVPLRERVVGAYRPSALVLPAAEPVPAGYHRAGLLAGGELALVQSDAGAYEVVPGDALALLLATSGSTGDPKFVRLSLGNLESNARSIVEYLAIGPGDTAIQGLPLHYSYGLSVLNSHLLAGGAVALTGHSFMRPEFWAVADACRCTSFAGVPYMYETLARLRQSPAERKGLRTLTQAGGHLRPDLASQLALAAASRDARFFVMYGQTEATARMAYVPPDRLLEKPGSIGIAVPRGELWLEPVDSDPARRQLFYRGPNVMLGYASGPEDLTRGDELGGVLATGDLAETDADGYFRIVGRLSRFAKLFGKRVNLAGVEAEVEARFPVRAAALEGAEALRLFIEAAADTETGAIRAHLASFLGVPPGSVHVARVSQLPLTASGKKDYKALA